MTQDFGFLTIHSCVNDKLGTCILCIFLTEQTRLPS